LDTLKKRYLIKLSASLIGLIVSLVTQAIVPRSLGPKSYGDFSYLTAVFSQVVGFFDMGTSLGFYTKISQRQKESGLVSFYVAFSLIVSAIIVLLVVLSQITSFASTLWPDQSIFFVYLAAIWAILTWYLQTIGNLGDAYGVTVPIEKVRIVQRIMGLLLVWALFSYDYLDLTMLFVCNFITIIFLIVATLWIIDNNVDSSGHDWLLSKKEIRSYTTEFYQYSRPLFTYMLVATTVGVLDRWLLQIFSGSVEQGFYGLSSQIGGVCFLFVNSMLYLILREFSIAYAEKDLAQMASLFRRYIPIFYGIVSFFSCFIVVQAESVAYIFGGVEFRDAGLAIAIMAFFQIHQTYGVLSGAVYMASGQTALYSRIGIASTLIGIPIGYFLLAPTPNMGLHAGAAGLAIKMVIVQAVGVNVHLYFNCRFLKLNFWRYVGHQVVSVLFFLFLSALATVAVNKALAFVQSVIVKLVVAGILYTCMVVVLLYFLPIVLGLRRKEILSMTQLVLKKIGR